jgi:hypothetical protein
MSTQQLDFTSYQSNATSNPNEPITYKNSALANRPLTINNKEGMSGCSSCKISCGGCKNCSAKSNTVSPAAAEDLFKPDNYKTEFNNAENNSKIVPITITQDYDQYVVLEKEFNKPDIITKLPVYDTNKPVLNKTAPGSAKKSMDLTTQFYVGSLTVIGLFVFFRLIQKTK